MLAKRLSFKALGPIDWTSVFITSAISQISQRTVRTMRVAPSNSILTFIVNLKSPTRIRVAMRVGVDWDEIWNGLDSEKNWEAEKYRAQSTLLRVQNFRRHAPSDYFVPEYFRRPNQDVLSSRCLGVQALPDSSLLHMETVLLRNRSWIPVPGDVVVKTCR